MATDTLHTLHLNQAPLGQQIRLTAIDGDHQLILKLLGMGMRVGTSLRITQRRGTSVVVACQDARIALGPGLAGRIQVVPEGEAP
jgi:ferrous iron transport protein A